MSTFRSPYDREFELQAQEEHKAYQRGYKAGQKSVLDKIRKDINNIVITGQIDNHTMFVRTADQIKQMIIHIVDCYIEGEEE